MAGLESGEAGLALASGIGAIFATADARQRRGGERHRPSIYGSTFAFFTKGLPVWHSGRLADLHPAGDRWAASEDKTAGLLRNAGEPQSEGHRHRRHRRMAISRCNGGSRQHLRLAGPSAADRAGRGHRRAFGHQISRRPWRSPGRHRLGRRQSSAGGAAGLRWMTGRRFRPSTLPDAARAQDAGDAHGAAFASATAVAKCLPATGRSRALLSGPEPFRSARLRNDRCRGPAG